MGRTEVSCTKNGKSRKEIWESGKCPYCGAENVHAEPYVRKIRAYRGIMNGVDYTCLKCGARNVFTKRL